jgi:hypothetical protein
MSHPAGEIISYRISPLRRSVLWMVMGPFLVMGVVMCFFPDTQLAGIILTVIISIFLGLWRWLVNYTRLELSPKGIFLRQFGWHLESPWEKIDHFRMDRGREGFVTIEPMQGKGARRLASVSGFGYYGTSMYSDEQRYWIESGQWIPVEPFMYAFRKGRMKAEIERFAPGLLEREPSGMAGRFAALTAPPEDGTPSTYAPPPRPPKSSLYWWVNGFFLFVIIIVPLATMSDGKQADRGVAIFLAFILGPLVIWRTALSCRSSFRKGSRLLGILFALCTMIAMLFEYEFFRQWLHPPK